ncbi:MAG: class I SAM-dependent methyltransferase [Actinomycetota bacterium]|nr:class I SAM-dependent methyltransferase [Actinomycetota bacterium]
MPSLTPVDRITLIERECANRRVLNLGCTDRTRLELEVAKRKSEHPEWRMGQTYFDVLADRKGKWMHPDEHLHLRVAKVANEIVGVDTDTDTLALLKKQPNVGTLINHDAEKLEDLPVGGEFDVIVAGELIEHLSNPGRMLEGARRWVAGDGRLILTTPNAFSLKFFLHNTLRRTDINSYDHAVMFSTSTLTELLSRTGWEPIAWSVAIWRSASLRSRLYALPERLLIRLFPQIGDTLICVARPV